MKWPNMISTKIKGFFFSLNEEDVKILKNKKCYKNDDKFIKYFCLNKI